VQRMSDSPSAVMEGDRGRKRKSVVQGTADLHALNVAAANSTLKLQLGGRQRSWQTGGTVAPSVRRINSGTTVPTQSGSLATVSNEAASAPNQLASPAAPFPPTSTSQLSRGGSAENRKLVGVNRSTPTLSPTVPAASVDVREVGHGGCRFSNPPSNSTSPMLANAVAPKDSSPVISSNEGANSTVLPSPAASNEPGSPEDSAPADLERNSAMDARTDDQPHGICNSPVQVHDSQRPSTGQDKVARPSTELSTHMRTDRTRSIHTAHPEPINRTEKLNAEMDRDPNQQTASSRVFEENSHSRPGSTRSDVPVSATTPIPGSNSRSPIVQDRNVNMAACGIAATLGPITKQFSPATGSLLRKDTINNTSSEQHSPSTRSSPPVVHKTSGQTGHSHFTLPTSQNRQSGIEESQISRPIGTSRSMSTTQVYQTSHNNNLTQQSRLHASRASNNNIDQQRQQSLAAKLENFRKVNAGILGDCDRMRLNLLDTAIRKNDKAFLVIHQLYCSHTLRNNLARDFGMNIHTHLKGMETIEHLIMANSLMLPPSLAFFADYPVPFHDYDRFDPQWRQIYFTKVLPFLETLAQDFRLLHATCQARNTPPVLFELGFSLKVPSLLLQDVIFQSITKRVWPSANMSQCDEILRYNRQLYWNLEQRHSSDSTVRPELYAIEDTIVLEKYRELRIRMSETMAALQASHRINRSSATVVPMIGVQNQGPDLSRPLPTFNTAHIYGFPGNLGAESRVRSSARVHAENRPINLPSPKPSSFGRHLSHTLPSNVIGGNTMTAHSVQPVSIGHNSSHNMPSIGRNRMAGQGPPGSVAVHAPGNTAAAEYIQPVLGATHSYPYSPRTQIPGHAMLPSTVQQTPSPTIGGVPQISYQNNYAPNPSSPAWIARSTEEQLLREAHSTQEHARHQVQRSGSAQRGGRPTPGSLTIIPPLPSNGTFPYRQPPIAPPITQVALMSPQMQFSSLSSRENIKPRLYQRVKQTILSRHFDCTLAHMKFNVPDELYDRIPDTLISSGVIPYNEVAPGTVRYRFRCVKVAPSEVWEGEKEGEVPQLAVRDTYWPPNIAVFFHGVPMDLRRSLQWKRDLPMHLSLHKSGPRAIMRGENRVKVFSNKTGPEMQRLERENKYGLGLIIELVDILTHDGIINMVNSTKISASVTRDAIIASLNKVPDDDEIAIVGINELTINLVDPFSGKMFVRPIKSIYCTHHECFDLENFLLSRLPKHEGEPCQVDVWKCPICSADARPQNLRLMEFFVGVRDELQELNSLGSRAIIVESDGTYHPKAEEESTMSSKKRSFDEDDMDTDDDQVQPKKQRLEPPRYPTGTRDQLNPRRSPTGEQERIVIDLDSD
jgi:zinc finger MIZ domain-containing protein